VVVRAALAQVQREQVATIQFLALSLAQAVVAAVAITIHLLRPVVLAVEQH
jgi:hypothetical protein